ncbi:unnamed protein product [Pleuronectes platessa]|uniref:Uncharacterized protein n=1 Tax=Pleuronectes platessa TaxID=8262 RepID=A0A9N7VE31_PLEPL|nr:unnamed protein product [Pleuronectes platessa]
MGLPPPVLVPFCTHLLTVQIVCLKEACRAPRPFLQIRVDHAGLVETKWHRATAECAGVSACPAQFCVIESLLQIYGSLLVPVTEAVVGRHSWGKPTVFAGMPCTKVWNSASRSAPLWCGHEPIRPLVPTSSSSSSSRSYPLGRDPPRAFSPLVAQVPQHMCQVSARRGGRVHRARGNPPNVHLRSKPALEGPTGGEQIKNPGRGEKERRRSPERGRVFFSPPPSDPTASLHLSLSLSLPPSFLKLTSGLTGNMTTEKPSSSSSSSSAPRCRTPTT